MNSVKRKTLKRMFSDFMIILTVIAIFIFSITAITFIFWTFISQADAATDKFQEAMQYANSLKSKNTVSVEGENLKIGTFKLDPQKTFSDPISKKSWYTNNPLEINYYSGLAQDNIQKMENDAIAATNKDETYKDIEGNLIPAPGKTIVKSFQTRPIFKVTDDGYITKGRSIIANARSIVSGESSKEVNCKTTDPENNKEIQNTQKETLCKTTYVEKNCNEVIRTIRKTRTPKITISMKTVTYPNCHRLIISQGVHNPCPSGYNQLLYSDMFHSGEPHWDDVYFCTQAVGEDENSECYSGGYYISNAVDRNVDAGRATVPKMLHARIKISNVYFQPILVTVINETMGKTLYSNASFSGGQTIELPYSTTQDQTFRFYVEIPNGNWRWRRMHMGIMILYIEHINREKVATIDPGEEENYNDI